MFTLPRLVLWERVWFYECHALCCLMQGSSSRRPFRFVAMERYGDEEMEARKVVLLRRGLMCKLKAKKLHGQLFCLVVRPVKGFVRLARPSFERKCLREHGEYHISIGFNVPQAASAEIHVMTRTPH